jgi:hypothetical protein
MSVNENPSTARHRSGSKISEIMAPIVTEDNPDHALASVDRRCLNR